MKSVFLTIIAVGVLTACATPEVVQTRQARDNEMTCAQLKEAYADAAEFEKKARRERGMTGTNIAAALFFWPAMLGTYKNTEDAIEAAKDGQRHLEKIAASKKCRIV